MLGRHDMGLETSRCGFESRNAHQVFNQEKTMTIKRYDSQAVNVPESMKKQDAHKLNIIICSYAEIICGTGHSKR